MKFVDKFLPLIFFFFFFFFLNLLHVGDIGMVKSFLTTPLLDYYWLEGRL